MNYCPEDCKNKVKCALDNSISEEDNSKVCCGGYLRHKEKFEELWNKYPKKLGKDKAIIHFNAQVKTEKDWLNINKALNNYIESENVKNGNIQYIQNGSTWFNKRWKDWIDYIEPNKPNTGKQSKMDKRVQGWADFANEDVNSIKQAERG